MDRTGGGLTVGKIAGGVALGILIAFGALIFGVPQLVGLLRSINGAINAASGAVQSAAESTAAKKKLADRTIQNRVEVECSTALRRQMAPTQIAISTTARSYHPSPDGKRASVDAQFSELRQGGGLRTRHFRCETTIEGSIATLERLTIDP